MTYTYKNSRVSSLIMGTSRILGLEYQYSQDLAKILGQLQTLFGDPLYISLDADDPYSYVIIMENEQGIRYNMHVYSAKFGPSIGGNKDIEGIEDAAQALKQYIEEASPSDYEYQGTYSDGRSVIMGVKDGEPYYSVTKNGKKVETGMNQSTLTLDEIFEKADLVARWEARDEARGAEKKAVEIAKNLLKNGFSVEQTAGLTGLDVVKVKALDNEK